MMLSSADVGKQINLLNPQELLSCAADGTPEGRRHLADAVAGFFNEHELSEQEQGIASEILLNLIHQAESDLRQVLAEQLALQPSIPSEVILYLANDEIPIARHILQHSPILKDVDLMYVISTKGYDYWQAIAKRENLSPFVTDRLIDTGDFMTVMNLVGNTRISLQKGSIKKMIKAALRSERLQVPLMRRPEIDNELAIELYTVVSKVLRLELTHRFLIPPSVIEQAAEGMIHQLSNETRGLREATDDMRALAKKFQEHGDITPELMIRTLRRGQIGFFLSLLAERTGLQPDHVSRLLDKDGGKPFVVACRAVGMMKSEFASIFLLSRGIGRGTKIVDQRELAQALKTFEVLKDYDVQRIMSSWIKNPDLI